MDDGSDQDYDSHIMVWQLPCVDGTKIVNAKSGNNSYPEIVVEAAEEAAADAGSANSLASSSLDLVPVSKERLGSGLLMWSLLFKSTHCSFRSCKEFYY